MAKPAAPTNLKAVYNVAADAIYVTLTPPAGATSIILQRWNGATMVYSTVTTLTGQILTYYFDSSVTPAETYAYRAQAINADGGSNYSTPSNKVLVIAPPATATNTKATRIASNGSMLVEWTNNPTVLAPIDFNYIFRWDNVSGATTQVNRIAGSLAAWQDYTVQPDRAYRYRVWPSNLGAGGAYYHSAYTGTVYSVPAAPTSVTGRWDGGTRIRVDWANPSTTAAQFEVEHSTDNVDWFPMATLGKVRTWWHDAPERAVPHYYRVRAITPTPTIGDKVKSAWATSPVVAAQSSPNAPLILGPAYAAASTAFTMDYLHQPVDGSAEGGVQLQHRAAGSQAWSATVAGATVPAQSAGTREVRMQTRTATSGWGAWSAPATVVVRARPTVSFTSPTAGQTLTGPVLPVSWTGTPSVQWEAELKSGATLLDAAAGTTETQTTLSIPEGSGFTLSLRTFDGYLWSATATRTVNATYAVPATPTLALVVDDDTATVTATAAGTGAARVEVMRRPAGTAERFVSLGNTVGGVVVDTLPPLLIDLEYVAVAWSASGASTSSEAVVARVDRDVVVVNYGPGLQQVATLELNLRLSEDVQAQQELYLMAGASKPLVVMGDSQPFRLAVSGVVVDDVGSPASVWRAVPAATQKWLRTPAGHSLPVAISAVSVQPSADGIMPVSFTAEEVAR